jgi:hypothetical protein
MTKSRSRKKTRVAAKPRTPAGQRRKSTRRIAPGLEAVAPRRPPALHSVAAETLRVTLDLRDLSGQPIRDPETFFTFRRLSGNRQVGDQLALELTGTAAPVFNLPIFTSEVLVCEIDPKRFRFVQSPVFFGSPGPAIEKKCQLFREPGEWTARFTRWQDLSSSFKPLKDVLGVSPQIVLFRELDPLPDLLIEGAYDAVAGQKPVLAKTALLNSYFMLSNSMEPVSGARSWFSFVRRIIAIGRERFLALVDPEMETLVRQIHAHIDQFRGDYERTPAENHRGNVPASMQSRIASMISIKSTQRRGNAQLTMTRLTGPDEVLLDSDIDEHGDLLAHVLDLLKHKFSGGTHPHDIHEILVQAANGSTIDLGYLLE